jgi:hypothetical protein
MPSAPSHSYNAEVMTVGCPRCGVLARQRCKGPMGNGATNMVIAHAARLALVGFRWNRSTGSLERVS